MSAWFARPVLHVTDVDASVRFYVERLGFTSPWRFEDDGRAHVAQVDRQGCALILADNWPEKAGKGLMFISMDLEQFTPEAEIGVLDALRVEFEAAGVTVSDGFLGLPAPRGRRSRRQSAFLQLFERARRCSRWRKPWR